MWRLGGCLCEQSILFWGYKVNALLPLTREGDKALLIYVASRLSRYFRYPFKVSFFSATSLAKYVMMSEAPARLIAMRLS